MAALSAPPAFFTAPHGSDKNPGTKDRPFASPLRAQQAVRELKRDGVTEDILVTIGGGVYFLDTPLVFGPEDSGTERHAITYAAAPGESPLLSGGRVITGWRELKQEPAAVSSKAGGKLWFARIPAVKTGDWFFRELFVNGRRRVRARSPNTGHFRVVKAGPDRRTSFTYRNGDLRRTANLTDVELVFFHDWCTSRIPIRSLDEEKHEVALAFPVGPRVGGSGSWGNMDRFERHPRYFVENALEFLDEPGQWFLDPATGRLYYYPHEGEDMRTAQVIAPLLKQILRVEGDAAKKSPVRNLHFRGLTFSHCAWLRPELGLPMAQATSYEVRVDARGKAKGRAFVTAAVEANSATGCSFEGCRFTKLGGSGLFLQQECHSNRVAGCTFADISANGIMVGRGRANRISNNLVEHCGRQFPGAVGVYVGLADGTVVAHNEIRNLTYTGISVGWNWSTKPTSCRNNIIEYNHIHNVMQELSDGGGIYTLGRQPGTVLRGNCIHDVRANVGRAESNGMFIDNGSTELLIEQNTIYAAARSCIRFNAGRRSKPSPRDAQHNTLRGNLLVVSPGGSAYGGHTAFMTFEDNTIVQPRGKQPRIVANGRKGEALLCDGLNSFFQERHSPSLDPSQFTIAAWVRVSGIPGGKDPRRWIVAKNANEWVEGHYALLLSGDAVGAYLNIGGGRENTSRAFSGPGLVKANRWHHLTATYDGKMLRVYLDGTPVAHKAVNRTRRAGSGAFTIGRRPDGFPEVGFRGLVDQVRLYDRALSPELIRRHATSDDTPETDTPPVKTWSFENNAPDPAGIKARMEKAQNEAGLHPRYRKLLRQESAVQGSDMTLR